MKAVKSFIISEEDSSINWAPNDAALYSIVNKDAKNKFGEFPGYRIKRGKTQYLIPAQHDFGRH